MFQHSETIHYLWRNFVNLLIVKTCAGHDALDIDLWGAID